MKYLLLVIVLFSILHIIRDIAQIKTGYNSWFTKFGHFWHAPQYEVHGIVVLSLVIVVCLYFFFR
jgi:antibiotic biosynthesis monooxygenase (ABM) superfamily enzyme